MRRGAVRSVFLPAGELQFLVAAGQFRSAAGGDEEKRTTSLGTIVEER
jgi:hypothetical protein